MQLATLNVKNVTLFICYMCSIYFLIYCLASLVTMSNVVCSLVRYRNLLDSHLKSQNLAEVSF